ncbi:hypothetical protein [Shouchella lonarensis]|uniref:hypothetical protein n=1 Tax=Shouchella lonarensis TaxID=1464122 RepID=UPI00114D4486|nr:hypothetical protein [Shouchella lonarensis]
MTIQKERVHYLYTVKGPAYGEEALVELICFAANWDGEISPCAEISEVDWISVKKTEWMAPAVVTLVEEYMER